GLDLKLGVLVDAVDDLVDADPLAELIDDLPAALERGVEVLVGVLEVLNVRPDVVGDRLDIAARELVVHAGLADLEPAIVVGVDEAPNVTQQDVAGQLDVVLGAGRALDGEGVLRDPGAGRLVHLHEIGVADHEPLAVLGDQRAVEDPEHRAEVVLLFHSQIAAAAARECGVDVGPVDPDHTVEPVDLFFEDLDQLVGAGVLIGARPVGPADDLEAGRDVALAAVLEKIIADRVGGDGLAAAGPTEPEQHRVDALGAGPGFQIKSSDVTGELEAGLDVLLVADDVLDPDRGQIADRLGRVARVKALVAQLADGDLAPGQRDAERPQATEVSE